MSRAIRLQLLDGEHERVIEGVQALRAADASGAFGLLPGHTDLVTVLEPGLFRYRLGGEADWRHVACSGGLLDCERVTDGNRVRILSGRFVHGESPEAVQAQLERILAQEQNERVSTRESRERLDIALLQHLQKLTEAT